MKTLNELQDTTAIVQKLLIEYPETRNSDGILYIKVLDYISKQLDVSLPFQDYPIKMVFSSTLLLPVPPFETVRRSRQKLQRAFPELAATERIRQKRADKEAAFRAYARG